MKKILNYKLIICNLFMFIPIILLAEDQNINKIVVDLYKNGKHQEAVDTAKKSLTQFVLKKEDSSPDSILLMVNLGIIYKKINELSLAESYLQTALKYQISISTADPLLGKIYKNLLDIIYIRSGIKKDTKLANKLTQEDDFEECPNFIDVIIELADYFISQNNFENAESLFKKALVIIKSKDGEEDPKIGEFYIKFGKIYLQQEKISEAEACFLQAYAFYDKAKENILAAYSLDNLGLVNKMKKKYAEAESFYRLSLQLKEKLIGKNNVDYADTSTSLGNLYAVQGNLEAEPLLLNSLEIYVTKLGLNDPNVGNILNDIADFYKKVGRNEEANKFSKRASEILSKK